MEEVRRCTAVARLLTVVACARFDLDKDGRLSMSELINATECFFEEVYHSSKAQVSAQVHFAVRTWVV